MDYNWDCLGVISPVTNHLANPMAHPSTLQRSATVFFGGGNPRSVTDPKIFSHCSSPCHELVGYNMLQPIQILVMWVPVSKHYSYNCARYCTPKLGQFLIKLLWYIWAIRYTHVDGLMQGWWTDLAHWRDTFLPTIASHYTVFGDNMISLYSMYHVDE